MPSAKLARDSSIPQISILVPVYNEEPVIEDFYKTLCATLAGLEDRYTFEILFTDNCSSDRTFELLSELSNKDLRVRILRFSRNFGFQRSVLTGYLNAQGAAAIQIDADLQDPPHLINEFLNLWETGALVVYGIRRSRQEAPPLTWVRRSFYKLINAMSDYPLPRDAGDFRLVDRRVMEELRNLRDSSPYIRGTIAGLGFNQVGIPYDREARKAGQSKFPVKELISLSIDGIISHSVFPLRFATYCGILIFIMAIIAGLSFVIGKIFYGTDWPSGFPTLVLILLMSVCVNAIFFGILGEYIGRIYHNTRNEPISIIDEKVGYPDIED